MERVTTWRSSEGARWLGWTVLYALIVYGVSVVFVTQTHETGFHILFPFSGGWGSLLYHLVRAVVAFGIGVRFRSWWWGLGPLTALALPAALFIIEVANPALDKDSQAWAVVFSLLFLVYGALFSLIGIAGVWWGKRREASESGSTWSSLGGDTSP
jgi:hypothetical protein